MVVQPRIDRRTTEDVVAQVRKLLPFYLKDWPQNGRAGQLDDALVMVFARFCEMIIARLNRAPEKNFLAFLDLLGFAPLPLEASRAPLSFYLPPRSAQAAKVPARTQAAAPPSGGQQSPIIFETDSDLVVVPVKLE